MVSDTKIQKHSNPRANRKKSNFIKMDKSKKMFAVVWKNGFDDLKKLKGEYELIWQNIRGNEVADVNKLRQFEKRFLALMDSVVVDIRDMEHAFEDPDDLGLMEKAGYKESDKPILTPALHRLIFKIAEITADIRLSINGGMMINARSGIFRPRSRSRSRETAKRGVQTRMKSRRQRKRRRIR